MGDFRGGLSVFHLGGIVDSAGEFCRRICGPFPASFLSLCAVLGRDSVFLEEGFIGGFSEVVCLLHGFWVWSGTMSTGGLPIFSSFQLGDQPLVPVHCSSSFLRQISPAARTQSLLQPLLILRGSSLALCKDRCTHSDYLLYPYMYSQN